MPCLFRRARVHAIGAGLVVCEIQQQSDVTYRLYDYGRPRELHLDKAMEVSVAGPHEGVHAQRALSPCETRLAECDYFVVDAVRVTQPWVYQPQGSAFEAVVVVEGELTMDGDPVGGRRGLPDSRGLRRGEPQVHRRRHVDPCILALSLGHSFAM